MKNIALALIALFVLVGCTTKQVHVIRKPVETPKKEEVVVAPETDAEIEKEDIEEQLVEDIVKDDELNKIAVIYPSRVVGKYAKSTISTLTAFLLYNNLNFEIETFDTSDETRSNILNQVNELNEKGFTKVIAMFTSRGYGVLNSLQEVSSTKFYFPLINKSEVFTLNPNFIFGGISYKDQLELLQALSTNNNTMFYVKSYLGDKLKKIYEDTFRYPGVIKEIERENNRYKYVMKDGRIVGDTVILNTPIVKTSIILSQLTAYEVYPSRVLSTQLNYTPLLIKLTQERDRKNFFVVSSISDVDDFLNEYTNMLGGDISYNWVDYSSLVGVNYLLFDSESNSVKTKVIDNQSDYELNLYESTSYGFHKIQLN